MGDLQCPVRVFLVAGPEAEGWVERLRPQRIAAVYATAEAAPTAAAVATSLQAGATVLPGSPAGPEQVRRALGDIADRHRGEAVLLLGETFVSALSGLVPGSASGADGVLAVEGDADGWRRVTAPA